VRIISGSYRGKQIHPPNNFKARPTTDFAKEGLFNILFNNFDFEETDVLDLFAGTGSVSYEFASRGTKRITCVENNSTHFKFIRRNIEEMDFEQVHTINTDVFKFIKKPFESYDLIFADPPYNHPNLKKLPELIFGTNILLDNGWFILEHPSSLTFNHLPNFFMHKNYGNVNFSFFKKIK